MHITIATHFCGGRFAASKVSFTGELASCGMENSTDNAPIQGKQIDTKCCDDNILTYSVDNNFSPSNSVIVEYFKTILQDLTIPVSVSLQSFISANSVALNVFPPGKLKVSSVNLSDICVFRI